MKKITLFFILIFLTYKTNAQNITNIYKKVNTSVVTILTESKSIETNFESTIESSLGSGVLISKEGEILTAAHVVNKAEKITIKFTSGEEIPAKVIRSISIADIALIKLSWMPENYTVAQIGNSDKTNIGEKIMIIGAPYGLGNSLSVGYISGKHTNQKRTSGFALNEYFQTDASINHGNSGGPMFNLKGEVIGISSYIISESGGFQGLGFAVTSNLAKKLVIEGHTKWTGINGYLIDKVTAWLLNVPFNGGMLVESVVDFSPAYYGGIKGGFQKVNLNGKDVILGGDIILSVNDIPLTQEVFEQISGTKKDNNNFLEKDSYKVKLLRGGKIEEIIINFKK
ncbi:trypsin-like peptidase domain-containing protein [Flavobacteriaceae bacterium]|nr:trypsin-like peptidase domain-containing protein [Flavobacteriaceae bacterium]